MMERVVKVSYLATFAAVFGSVGVAALYDLFKRNENRRNMMEIHNKYIRRAFACMKCEKQMFPIEIRYCCGVCEMHDYCESCWKYADKTGTLYQLHNHYLYYDKIYPEVESFDIDNAKSVSEALLKCFEIYSIRPLMGIRRVLKYDNGIENEFSNEFTWISYNEAKELSLAFGQGLKEIGIPDRCFIGLCGVSSNQWLLSQYGCFLKGFIPVPLHATFSAKQLIHIAKKSNLKVLIISKNLLPQVIAVIMEDTPIQTIILMDDYSCAYSLRNSKNNDVNIEEYNSVLKSQNIESYTWNDIEKHGKKSKSKYNVVHLPFDEIGMLLSTSGSSGMPKLTVFTNERLCSSFHSSRPVADQMVVLSIEPMRQSMDMLCKGGRCGIYCGRFDKLMEDIKCLRPTILGATPSFWNNLYCEYQQFYFDYQQNHPDCLPNDYIDIYKSLHLFGNRLRVVLAGGAPLNKNIQDWLFQALGAFVLNGYGTTETGGISSNNSINPGVNLQLLDCPELYYLTSDLPYPRGEIIAKTDKTIPGYYNDEEKTTEAFITLNGVRFFRTGDIGRFVNGNIEIIDRKKSMLKLAQGFFVAPEYLETVYNECLVVKQIYIFGDSRYSCVGAVVVPSEMILNKEEELEEDIILLIRENLRNIAKLHDLQPWEVPQVIIIEHEEFSVWNNLLTTIGKQCRPKLLLKYRFQFEELFNSIKTLEFDKKPLKQEDLLINDSGLCNGVQLLLKDILDLPSGSFSESDSILQLGADSLALARLTGAIKRRFGAEIPLPALVKFPTLALLQTAIFSGMNAVSDIINTNTITIDNLPIEVSTLWEHFTKQQIVTETIDYPTNDSILLTGANGFLGCFLLTSLLNSSNKNIICIIRGSSNEVAKGRLLSALKLYKLELSLSNIDRIQVFAGDISKENFGLEIESYKFLQSNINVVYHNAAMVNSIYNYEQHKPTNVIGTLEILKFINRSPPLDLHYISTVGMLGGCTLEQVVVPLSQSHSNTGGYGLSKWVSETLINIFNEEFGGKVRIYRPSTIFSSTLSGASNTKDTVNRMICGLICEKIICNEIYNPNSEQCMLPVQMNLVPVDWAADSIIHLSNYPIDESVVVYHISNAKLTNLSFLLDLIQECGIELQKVSEYKFKKIINSISDESHPFFMTKSIIVNSGYATTISKPDTEKTYSLLPQDAPEITLEHFRKTINFFKENRFY